MELSKYNACICEGTAEQIIIDLLLDNDKLIFSREELLEHEVLRCRSGKKFEEQYLRKGFTEQITVFRILDSRRENFKIACIFFRLCSGVTYPQSCKIMDFIIIVVKTAECRFKRNMFRNFQAIGLKTTHDCNSVGL